MAKKPSASEKRWWTDRFAAATRGLDVPADLADLLFRRTSPMRAARIVPDLLLVQPAEWVRRVSELNHQLNIEAADDGTAYESRLAVLTGREDIRERSLVAAEEE